MKDVLRNVGRLALLSGAVAGSAYIGERVGENRVISNSSPSIASIREINNNHQLYNGEFIRTTGILEDEYKGDPGSGIAFITDWQPVKLPIVGTTIYHGRTGHEYVWHRLYENKKQVGTSVKVMQDFVSDSNMPFTNVTGIVDDATARKYNGMAVKVTGTSYCDKNGCAIEAKNISPVAK